VADAETGKRGAADGRFARHLAQLLRYGGIGLCCVAVNLVVLYVGTDVLGMHYLVSAGFAFALVAPFGYWLHKYLAFRETTRCPWRRRCAT
jgi:putative flippase GtrA